MLLQWFCFSLFGDDDKEEKSQVGTSLYQITVEGFSCEGANRLRLRGIELIGFFFCDAMGGQWGFLALILDILK